MEEKQLYVSPAKKIACNVVDALIAVAAVAIILLSRFGIIGVPFSQTVVGIALSAAGAVFFINALIQWNSVSMWIAFCFFVPAGVSFACKAFGCSYAELYPIYIAIPGIACLGAMIISREFLKLLTFATLFILAGAIFLLHVFGILGLGYTFVVLIAYIALVTALIVIYLRKGDKK